MDLNLKRFVEPLEHDIDIHHKISLGTDKKNYHLHEQFEIVYVLSDNLQCMFEQNGCPVAIPKGSILLLNTMTLHYMFTQPRDYRCERYVLYFYPKLVMELQLPNMGLLESFSVIRDIRESIINVPDDRRAHVQGLLDSMCRAFDSMERDMDRMENEVILKMNLVQLLIELKKLHRQRLTQLGIPADDAYLQMSSLGAEMRDYIEDNACRDLSVEEICHQFLIGKQRLYEIFDKVYGMTVNDYKLICRISKAKDLLLNTSLPVEIISENVGYNNTSSFSRSFRRETGTSPLQYRERARNIARAH